MMQDFIFLMLIASGVIIIVKIVAYMKEKEKKDTQRIAKEAKADKERRKSYYAKR